MMMVRWSGQQLNTQARKKDCNHYDVIYDVILAWLFVNNAEIMSLIPVIRNIRLGKIFSVINNPLFLEIQNSDQQEGRGANLKLA